MNQSLTQDEAQVTAIQPHPEKESFISRVFLTGMVTWLIVSLGFWAWYISTQEFVVQFIYMYIWLLLFGLPLWIYRHQVEAFLEKWTASPALKFILLGYGMVLLEEIFAALVNNLSEGFEPLLYFIRIGQFWLFNIFAFSGLIIGWYFLLSRFRYSRLEAFMLVGLYGLKSERIINLIPGDLIAFIFFAVPVMFIYGLILSPSILSLPKSGDRNLPFILRWLLGVLVPMLVSVPFMMILNAWRAAQPGFFPPTNFIP